MSPAVAEVPGSGRDEDCDGIADLDASALDDRVVAWLGDARDAPYFGTMAAPVGDADGDGRGDLLAGPCGVWELCLLGTAVSILRDADGDGGVDVLISGGTTRHNVVAGASLVGAVDLDSAALAAVTLDRLTDGIVSSGDADGDGRSGVLVSLDGIVLVYEDLSAGAMLEEADASARLESSVGRLGALAGPTSFGLRSDHVGIHREDALVFLSTDDVPSSGTLDLSGVSDLVDYSGGTVWNPAFLDADSDGDTDVLLWGQCTGYGTDCGDRYYKDGLLGIWENPT